MTKITRRDTLRLASIGGLGLLLNSDAHGMAGEDDEISPKAKTEILLIGPLSLRELYKDRPDKRSLGDAITDGEGPSESDISEVLKGCQLFIIDKKYESKTGGWKFAQNPKIAAGGELEFKLKTDDHKDFKLYFGKLARGGCSTNYTHNPPTREFRVAIEFEIVMGDTWTGELSRYGVELPLITYDVNGKILSTK